MMRITALRLIGLFGLGLMIAGCAKPAPVLAPTKPAEVVVTRPIQKKVVDHEDFTGHTDPVNSVDIRTQVSGYLEKVNFKDGQDVKKDDLLFEIDPRTYEATLDQTLASEAQAAARLERVKRDYDRVSKLEATTAISREELDRYYSDKLEAAASLKSTAANRKLAETNLGYTKIHAKFDGRISRRNVDPGNIVKANETLLTTLVALDPIYASFDVDERTLLRIRRLISEGKADSARLTKIEVQIGLADEEGFPLIGVIDFADNRVDMATGTLRVRATLDNAKLLLSPGLFVRVRIPIGRPHEALLIPEEALGSDQGQRYVYIVNDKDEVVYRRVKTGMQVDQYRVIDEGVSLTDRVIIRGLQRVRPGVKANPKTEEEAKAATAKRDNEKKESDAKAAEKAKESKEKN